MGVNDHVSPRGREKFNKVEDGLRAIGVGLAKLLLVEPATGIEVRIKQRGEYDWLVIAKKTPPRGEPKIIFGFGTGPIEALLGAEGQIQSGKWRMDRPYKKEE